MTTDGSEGKFRMMVDGRYPSGWRDYQRKLRRAARTRRVLGIFPLLAFSCGFTLLLLLVVFQGRTSVSGYVTKPLPTASADEKPGPNTQVKPPKRPAALIPRELNLAYADIKDRFVLERGKNDLTIDSSIDAKLQERIETLLQNSQTVQAAVVVLNPKDGRVIAMASFDTAGGTDNLCLKADFPAASVFKIVSAAAAMDSAGYTPNRPVYYVGRKHTLYKGQLKKRTNTYGAKVSFSEAFASSINSVFGKVGIYDLGKQVMTEYAERFLFNRAIPFDLPVSKSTTQIPESDFEVAEFASGFNKKTRISPLHAALLASAVVNEGHIMAPWLVRRITSESGTVLFEREPKRLASPISPAVAEGMKVLMRETVLYGTCKKTFRRLRRKKAFKHIDLGAKTGNINDSSDRFKYDWLTAYVVPSKGDQSICISVLCVHGKALGVRANRLGRLIIRYYVLS